MWRTEMLIIELYTPDVIVRMYEESHATHSVVGLLYWACCNGFEIEGLAEQFFWGVMEE